MSQLSSFTATTPSLRFSSLTRRARVGWLGTALLGVALCWTGSAQAAPMIVTSLADFNTAIGSAPTTTDPFNNDIPGAVTINLDSLVVSTLAGGNLSFANSDNTVVTGLFRGGVDGDGSLAALTQTWTFPTPVIGFGGEFASVNRVDVQILGDGTYFDIFTELGNNSSGFFGLVHLTPFTQVEFSGNSNIFDAFRLDNLIFAAAPTTDPVPEPSTMVLLGTGLASMVAWRFKKQPAKN